MSRNRVRSSRVRVGGGMQDRYFNEGEVEVGSLDNLMDVMLVFACGLLIALVANWNVDLSEVSNVSSPSGSANMEALDGQVEETDPTAVDTLDGFTDLGRVYRDEETGDLYVLAD